MSSFDALPDAKLFEYYENQSLLPTFANFSNRGDLDRYAEGRERVFNECFLLPTRIFRGADVLEFGPDSGENALVFAKWGANLTLVEPNARARDQIRSYFAKFDLEWHLQKLISADVAGFRSERQFDVIDAEGFIYTIQPPQAWLQIFRTFTRPGGYWIISYYELYGAFFELALKAIHAAVKALTGSRAIDAAQLVFQAKWDSIPHTRSFASWVMDVMENPFVRIRYFLDAADLIKQAHAQGFTAHSAWPVYTDPLAIRWHKAKIRNDEMVAKTARHLERSRLSFASGRKLYLVGGAESVDRVSLLLNGLLADLDALIDQPFGPRLQPLIDGLGFLIELAERIPILADDDHAKGGYLTALQSLQRIFSLISRRDLAALTTLTATDPAFIAEWGMPSHFLVMRRRSPADE